MEATKRPWRVERDEDANLLVIQSGIRDVAVLDPLSGEEVAAANAALIVRAVNCHEDAMAVARALVKWFDECPEVYGDLKKSWKHWVGAERQLAELKEAVDAARALLAKAE